MSIYAGIFCGDNGAVESQHWGEGSILPSVAACTAIPVCNCSSFPHGCSSLPHMVHYSDTVNVTVSVELMAAKNKGGRMKWGGGNGTEGVAVLGADMDPMGQMAISCVVVLSTREDAW